MLDALIDTHYKCQKESPNCRKMDLSYCNLSGLNRSYKDLSGFNFYGTVCTDTDFTGSDLSFAVFDKAYCVISNFSTAICDNMFLNGAYVVGVKFRLTKFRLVSCEKTVFCDCDFYRCDRTGTSFSLATELGSSYNS